MASIYKPKKATYYSARHRIYDAHIGEYKWAGHTTKCKTKDAARRVSNIMDEIATVHAKGHTINFEDYSKRLVEVSGFPDESDLSPNKAKKLLDSIWRKNTSHGQLAENLTIIELIEKYYQTKDIAAATIEKYRTLTKSLQRSCQKMINRPASSYRVLDAQYIYEVFCSKGNTLNAAKEKIGILRTVYRYGVMIEAVEKNPFEGVMYKHTPKVKRKELFTPSDIQKMLKYFDTLENKDWKTLLLLGLCTGGSIGDCLSIKKSNIVTINGKKHITLTRVKKARSGQEYTLPIVDPLLSHIESILPTLSENDSLTPSLSIVGGSESPSIKFVQLAKQAGVDCMPYQTQSGRTLHAKTFHTIRATVNSNMQNAGVPLSIAQKVLDHESAKVNTDHYLQADSESKQSAIMSGLGRMGVTS